MAGKTVLRIFCWEIDADLLHVYLASTEVGAFRVELGMRRNTDCVSYFRELFPHAELHRAKNANRPLLRAVEKALQGENTGPLNEDIQLTSFQRTVLKAITRIPFGKTATYGEVAEMIGKPKACRAVGQVMGSNPLALIYP